MATQINVATSIATESTTGVDDAYDVSFTLSWEDESGEHSHEGEATLLRHDQTGHWGSWGSAPDHWLDGRTVALLTDWPEGGWREALSAIESACAEECPD